MSCDVAQNAQSVDASICRCCSTLLPQRVMSPTLGLVDQIHLISVFTLELKVPELVRTEQCHRTWK